MYIYNLWFFHRTKFTFAYAVVESPEIRLLRSHSIENATFVCIALSVAPTLLNIS